MTYLLLAVLAAAIVWWLARRDRRNDRETREAMREMRDTRRDQT